MTASKKKYYFERFNNVKREISKTWQIIKPLINSQQNSDQYL